MESTPHATNAISISKAIIALNQSLALYERLKRYDTEIYNLNILGNIYKGQSEFEKARELHLRALGVARIDNATLQINPAGSAVSMSYAQMNVQVLHP